MSFADVTIGSYNCRGLRDPIKANAVLKLFNDSNIDILLL